MTIPLETIRGMPAHGPYFAPPPTRYRNMSAHYVRFRAELAAVDRVLPSCFEPSEDGICVAFGLDVPWSSNWGAFRESGLFVGCRYDGRDGYYVAAVFLSSKSSIPAGREIWGTPKIYAELDHQVDQAATSTSTRIDGTSLFDVRSTMKREAGVSELPNLEPTWRLKAIPRADGQGLDVLQLIGASNIVSDVTTHDVRVGDGEVTFHRSSLYDLSDFAPRETLGAHYVEMDFTEGYGEIVKDFLK